MYRKGAAITLFALVFLLVLAPSPEAAKVRLSIGGSFPGSVANMTAGAIATFVTKEVENVFMSAPSSQGFLHNIRAMERGQQDFMLNSTGLSVEAVEGIKPFEKKYVHMRGFLPWVSVPYHVAVLPASGIKTFADMKGKRVNVGPKGSQGGIISKTLLEAAGVLKTMSVEYMNYAEGTDAFTDNRVQVGIYASPMPDANLLQVSSVTGGVLLLPVTGEIAAKSIASMRGRHPMTIPAGMYKGVDKPVETIGHTSFIAVRDSVPGDVVYQIISKMLSDTGRTYLTKAHKGFAELYRLSPGFNIFAAGKLRLHPGVERYWKEKGVEIPPEVRAVK